MQTFTAAAAGYYLFIVAGGQGGFLGYGADLVTLPGLGATRGSYCLFASRSHCAYSRSRARRTTP